jgi:hypothetical protein
LHELLARAVFVPGTVAAHDLQQVVDRVRALPVGIERRGEIETRLMIERVGCDLGFELVERANRFRLFGDFECGAGGASGTRASVCLACSSAPVST